MQRVAGIIPEQQRVASATPTTSEEPPDKQRQNKAKQVRFDVPRVNNKVRFDIPTSPTEGDTIPRHLTAEAHDLKPIPPTRRSNRQRGLTVQEVREQEAILADVRPTRQPTRPREDILAIKDRAYRNSLQSCPAQPETCPQY